LLTERSINRWAQQLAAEHNYPVDEVLCALAEAVIQNELPVYHRSIFGVDDEPIDVYRLDPIIKSLTSVLYWPFLGLGRANHHLKDLDNLMITAADMARWRRVREHWPEKRSKAGEPDTHTPKTQRRRGRPPTVFEATVAAIKNDLAEDLLTRKDLEDMKQVALSARYHASRGVVIRARTEVLSEIVGNSTH
jgi:hypothetical protein